MDNHPGETTPQGVTAAKRAVSGVSPFTFASHSIAHEGHPERNEDTILVDRGVIFEKRNGIMQRLGHFTPKAPSLTIHTAQTVIAPGDRMLLCSDGVHDNLTDAEIETIVQCRACTVVACHLVQRALDRSREECLRAKKDDMSAIVITCNW